MTDYRNRIIGLEYVDAAELKPHDKNWRRHPENQSAALRGILSEVGIADALIAYRSPRNGEELTVIDGHLRQQAAPQPWPVLVLDLNDDEADLLLAAHDPLAAMAETDGDALAALLQEVQADDEALQAMLDQMAEDAGIIPPDFEPVGEDEQPRLDQKAAITCPHCGAEFVPDA